LGEGSLPGQVRLAINALLVKAIGKSTIKQTDRVGKMAVRESTIRQTDLEGKTTLGKQLLAKLLLYERSLDESPWYLKNLLNVFDNALLGGHPIYLARSMLWASERKRCGSRDGRRRDSD